MKDHFVTYENRHNKIKNCIVISDPYPITDEEGAYYATHVVIQAGVNYTSVDIDYLTRTD